MAKLSRLLVKKGRVAEADSLFEKCSAFVEKDNRHECEDVLIECAYLLTLAFFKTGTYYLTKVNIHSCRIIREITPQRIVGPHERQV